jgi:putative endonuclease
VRGSPGSAEERRRLRSEGERLAEAWYVERGYEVVARNWRCALGEIDLICRRGDVLVICEVKSRRSSAFGTPAEAVTLVKQRRLRRLAGRWLAEHRHRWADLRFDVVSVDGAGVLVTEGAF